MKIRKQQVKVIVARVSPWDLTGSSDSIYRSLKDTENLYLTENPDIIKAEWDWESPSSDDSNGSFVLEITRLENDKEYNARVKRLMKIKQNEKISKEKEEQRELEEYLRLKKKFGDNYLHRKFDDKEWSKP